MLLTPLILAFTLISAPPNKIKMPEPPTPVPQRVKLGECGDIYIKEGQAFYDKIYVHPENPNMRYEFIGYIDNNGDFDPPILIILIDLELQEVAAFRKYPAGNVEVWAGPNVIQESAMWFCGGYKDRGKEI